MKFAAIGLAAAVPGVLILFLAGISVLAACIFGAIEFAALIGIGHLPARSHS